MLSNIYLLNENGQFEATKLSYGQEIADKLASGRFFVRDPDGFLRQLQLEDDKDFPKLSASRPVKPEVPAAPSFWTRVRAFFGHKASKDMIQTYNEAKKFDTACRNLTANLENNINLNPPDAEYREETLAPDERKKITLQTQTALNKIMSENDFHIHLNKDRDFSRKEYDHVFDKKDVTAQDIKDAYIKLLKAEIACRLFSIDNLNKDHAQHTYLKLTENIENFLNAHYSNAVDHYVAQAKTGDQAEIANAKLAFWNIEANMGVNKLIEFRRPPHWENDHYYQSITAQMMDHKVINSARQKMSNREEYLEKQHKLAHFEEDLIAASKFSSKDMQAIMDGNDPDFDTYMDGLEKLMTAQVANMLLKSTEIKDIKATMPIYEELTVSIWDFVGSEYQQKVYNIMDALKFDGKEEASKLSNELINEVVKTGMGKLLEALEKNDPQNEAIQELNNQLKKPSAEMAKTV